MCEYVDPIVVAASACSLLLALVALTIALWAIVRQNSYEVHSGEVSAPMIPMDMEKLKEDMEANLPSLTSFDPFEPRSN
jgi:hypothetical protein